MSSVSPLPNSILPWHGMPWQQLLQARQQQRLPHGLLFVGDPGLGKRQLAETFAASLLCSDVSALGASCENCHACHMIKAKSHPDMLVIEPEKEGQAIGVDAIREMVKSVNETATFAGYKVIIIAPATAMNVNAANALLKTLEEPTPNTVIILLSDHGLKMPATILSRCQKVIFPKASASDALTWLRARMPDAKIDPALLLALSDGAPLRALAWLESDYLTLRKTVYDGLSALCNGKADPLQLASKMTDVELLSVLNLVCSWLADMLRFHVTQSADFFHNQDYSVEITHMSSVLSQDALLEYEAYVRQSRSAVLTSVSLNKQLFLEDLWIRWVSYVFS